MEEALVAAYRNGWIEGLEEGNKVFNFLLSRSIEAVEFRLSIEFTRRLFSQVYTGYVSDDEAKAKFQGKIDGARAADLIIRKLIAANPEAPIAELETAFSKKMEEAKERYPYPSLPLF